MDEQRGQSNYSGGQGGGGQYGTPPPAPPQPPAYPGQYQPRRPGFPWGWILGIVLVVMVLGCGLIGMTFIGAMTALSGPKQMTVGDSVALIRLDGIISDGGESGMFGATGGAGQVMRYMRQAGDDKGVKAVVLRINSPGGAAAASQELYEEATKLRQKKPLIVSMGDVAASGGYYVASASNHIFANGATTTGSIGVIAEFMHYNKLADKIGLSTDTITSGPYKDAGSPWREMRPEERQLFKGMIMGIYEQFVRDVAVGRKLAPKKVRQLADGRVYSGEQAKKVGLVDDIGNLYDAISYAGKEGKLGDNPKVKEYGRKTVWDMFTVDSEYRNALAARLLLHGTDLRWLTQDGGQPRTEANW